MKKTFTLLSMVLASSFAFAQSPRLVMVEAFSQASCAPCAAQNPALNAALDAAGTGVAVSVKYQTDWPGYDPMNEQNPSEVQTRVTYYNVTGVPSRRLDGNQGTSVTGTTISSRQAVTSPFTLGVNHVFNADKSAATVNINLTASQAFTASGNLVLHVAMVEKEIDFETAPGTNGELVFHSVMRKMIPSSSGSALPATWTNGQSQTFALQINTPNYIYKVGEIAFVAWVQDNGTKEVHQAGYSAPQPVASSASVTSLTGVPVFQCTNTFTPSIVIKNTGTTALTSGTIKYQIDANTEQSLPWTGNLAAGQVVTQALPLVNATPGIHTFKTYLSNPNGTPLFTTIHDSKQKQFTIIGATGIISPIYEDYILPAFPPASWFITNPDNGFTWGRATTAGALGTTKSAFMNFFNSTAGNVDEMYLPTTNLTMGTAQASLDFYVAYATYQTEQDKLEIKVSTDCGTTWTTVFNKAGSALQTANPQTTAYVPTAAQWRLESVDMTPFINQTKVMVKFVATSAYGNNLYLDEINLHSGPPSPLAVKDINAINSFEVFPNPFENQTTLNINTTKSERISFDVVDMLGNKVMSQDLGVVNGLYRQNIDATAWNAGIYFININSSEGGTITKKINVVK
jgi:hypothetical protein